MPKDTTVDKKEQYLLDKRDELMWALSVQQDYQPFQIAKIFNIRHLSTVTRIIMRKPERWVSPWVKREKNGSGEVGPGR